MDAHGAAREPNGLGPTVNRAAALADSDPASALELLSDVELKRWRRVDPATSARAHYLRARLLADRGEYQQALGAIRSARHDWLAAGMGQEAHRTDLARSSVLTELGEHQEALSICHQLLATLDDFSRHDRGDQLTRAGAFSNLGNARNLMGDHLGSISDYDMAANLFAALGERGREAEMDANRANACLRIGMVHRAVEDLRRARETLNELGQVLPAAKCAIDLAYGMLTLRRTVSALAITQEVVGDLERLNAFPELARLRLVLANALLQFGHYGDAHEQALVAAETFRELTLDTGTARAMHAAGWASLENGDLVAATEELGLADRLFEACQEPTSRASVWLVQARLLDRQGKRTESIAQANAALMLLQDNTTARVTAAHAHLLLADLVDDISAAVEHHHAAAGLVDQFGLESLRLYLELVGARLQRADGDLEGAAQTLRSALIGQRDRLIAAGRFLSDAHGGDLLRTMTGELIEIFGPSTLRPLARAPGKQPVGSKP